MLSNVEDLFSVLIIKIVVVDQGFVEGAIENEFFEELDQVLGLGHNLITWFRALDVSKEGLYEHVLVALPRQSTPKFPARETRRA